jgi:hypothetical protein
VLSFVLQIAVKIALPLSIPIVFSIIWFLSYKALRKPIPNGAGRTFWIWLVMMILVVPTSFGFMALTAVGGHTSDADLLPGMVFIAAVWLSIIPILIYKSVRQSKISRDDA